MNSNQHTTLAVLFGVIVSILAVHNPLEGYDNSKQIEGPLESTWQGAVQGCTPSLKDDYEFVSAVVGLPMSDEKLRQKFENAKQRMTVANYQKCVWNHHHYYQEEKPISEWVSIGAFHHAIASVKNLCIAISATFLWGVIALYALRSRRQQ